MADLKRHVPSRPGRIAYEHGHRYAVAMDYVADATVLDVACGEGYGSSALATVARQVLALDDDADGIATARARYGSDRLEFVRGDATAIPAPDASFDVVVSFGTIEDASDTDRFLSEVKRVLKPDGLLILSVSDAPACRKGGAATDAAPPPGFDRGSLDRALAGQFANREMLGQRLLVGSILTPLMRPRMPNAPKYRAYTGEHGSHDRSPAVNPGIVGPISPECLLCFCSDGAIRHPVGPDSIFLLPDDDLRLDHRQTTGWTAGLRDETAALRQTIRDLENRIEESHALGARHETAKQSLLAREEEARRTIARAELAPADDGSRILEELDRHLSPLAPLLSRFKGEDTAASVPALAEVLATAWHERSRVDKEIDDLRARLAESIAQRDQLAAATVSVAASQNRIKELSARNERDRQMWAEREAAQAELASAENARSRALRQDIASLRDSFLNSKVDIAWFNAAFQDLVRQVVKRHSGIEAGAQGGMVEDLAGMVDLVAYRAELAGDLLEAARAAGRARAAIPASGADTVDTLSPIEHGEDLCERLFFDEAYYTARNPERVDGGVDALRHYLETGWKEGRSPCALFDGDWYLNRHPQVLESGLSPLSHYVRQGAAAGLQPHPCFDRAYYVERHPDALRHTPDAFQHFVRQGLEIGNAPSARIETLACGRPAVDVLSFILGTDLRGSDEPADPKAWPPPLDDYWPPQGLRDYVGDEFGQDPIAGLSYLLSVIAAYDGRPDDFDGSREAQYLARRCRAFKHESRKLRPDVSIIIPVHDNLVYTLTSIVSILEHKTSHSLEIIVGDDCSTDATPQVVETLGRAVTLVRHATNLGFLQNCNACARQAEGRYLVFLNNDTIVLPGWLDNLIAPLQSDTNVGMTGSKLINGDGTLQEAGGIVWRDGSAWNYGRGGDPRLPHFSYSKEVDYCSGASIALSRLLWDELGGFDATLAPAYCEDSDLAFRVRAAGSRMWFAATSVLIHHEGRSHGRDVETGIKAYQVTNQAKLVERWNETLATENEPNAQNVFLARDRSGRRPHILVVDRYIPQWDRDAGSRTMLHFINMFVQQGFQVTFWPDNLYLDRTYARPLQDAGVEIIYGSQYVKGFDAWFQDVSEFFSYALLGRPDIAEKYIDHIDRGKTKILYYGHDIHWKRLENQWSVHQTDALLHDMTAMRELEERVCIGSDVVLYPSQEEIAILGESLPSLAAVAVPAWCFSATDIDAMRTQVWRLAKRDERHLMFVGGFDHQPNIDGINWFMSEVWPKIRAAHPDTRLTIAGSNPPESVTSLVNLRQSITVSGHISDLALDRLYKQATVALVPLRFGGGVKGKVIEAFSKGVPVVSTSTGVQGIENADDICFVADNAQDFAESILICVDDSARYKDKTIRAVEFLAKKYSYRSLAEKLEPHIQEIGHIPH